MWIKILLILALETATAYRIKRNVDQIAYANTADSSKAYAILIDAGSTGSRVYIYWWLHPISANTRILHVADNINKKIIATHQVRPGLSSFVDNVTAASDSIKTLLQYAAGFIPQEKKQFTPVITLATVCTRKLYLSFRG